MICLPFPSISAWMQGAGRRGRDPMDPQFDVEREIFGIINQREPFAERRVSTSDR